MIKWVECQRVCWVYELILLIVDFIPGLVAPRVGVLDRTGLTILVCIVYLFTTIFIVKYLAMFLQCRIRCRMTCYGTSGFWYTRISIGIKAVILFCLWMRSEGRYFLVHEQGRRFILKSCLNVVGSYFCLNGPLKWRMDYLFWSRLLCCHLDCGACVQGNQAMPGGCMRSFFYYSLFRCIWWKTPDYSLCPLWRCRTLGWEELSIVACRMQPSSCLLYDSEKSSHL